jgi:DUF2905 family protein
MGMGKLLILAGAALVVVGFVVVLAGRANLPVGRLPGDILYRGRSTTFYFPIVTCIVLSIILSFIMYVANRFLR